MFAHIYTCVWSEAGYIYIYIYIYIYRMEKFTYIGSSISSTENSKDMDNYQ